MAKYRKKPVEVEAIQFDGRNFKDIINWTDGIARVEYEDCIATTELFIDTLEGIMTSSPMDYIIKGVQGEFYPCKSDIFEKTYELVEDKNMGNYSQKYTMSKYLNKEHLLNTLLKDIGEVYKIANNILYFDDRSDYKSALWEIISLINPQLDEYEDLEYIE